MKIVLVGYMGSGKSTIGRILANRLNIKFLDLDDHIEAKEGMGIPQLFESKGEIYFRKKENEHLKQILNGTDHFILSTGGGTPCYGNNMEAILEATPNVFYLKVTIPGLIERLAPEKAHRPLIANIPDGELPEFIGKHLFERSFFYSMAEHAIQTDGKSVEAIVAEIEALLV
ncbi:shikimate kinase [Maribacter polysiphoniae]|uniref:Shikimate kinase n=2 Tax=Maribacter polysiphoniae TaxID=429344 RepID=A0A316E732_9FLAO|nr:shikimate kinase [Maribacter polysiphoniae]PWK24523.1 shikimate kinase [Maribacter polysiphoniae]